MDRRQRDFLSLNLKPQQLGRGRTLTIPNVCRGHPLMLAIQEKMIGTMSSGACHHRVMSTGRYPTQGDGPRGTQPPNLCSTPGRKLCSGFGTDRQGSKQAGRAEQIGVYRACLQEVHRFSQRLEAVRQIYVS